MPISKIYLYIVLNVSFLFIGFDGNLSAQQKKDTTNTILPVFQGFTLEFNLVPLAEMVISNGANYGIQSNIQFNLNKKYFPVIEIGYGGAKKSLHNSTAFAGYGLYEKIGIDFNLLKQKTGNKTYNNFLLAGIRLGSSQMSYSINNLTIEDNYWGVKNSNINYNNQKNTYFWYEISAGVRVEVSKKIMLGWNVQNKQIISNISNGNIYPWYISGYGKTASALWGFSYIVGYKF